MPDIITTIQLIALQCKSMISCSTSPYLVYAGVQLVRSTSLRSRLHGHLSVCSFHGLQKEMKFAVSKGHKFIIYRVVNIEDVNNVYVDRLVAPADLQDEHLFESSAVL